MRAPTLLAICGITLSHLGCSQDPAPPAAVTNVPLTTAERIGRSQPSDPWVLPHASVENVLLFIPFTEDGIYTAQGYNTSASIEGDWSGKTPPQSMIVPSHVAWEILESMAPYVTKQSKGVRINPEHEDTLIAFMGATHIIRGEYTADDENTSYTVRIDQPTTDPLTKTFTKSNHERMQMNDAISAWLVDSLRIHIPDDIVEILREPSYAIYPTEEQVDLLNADVRHPLWDEFHQHATNKNRLLTWRAFAARNNGDLGHLNQSTPVASDQLESIDFYLQRIYRHSAANDHDNLLHERVILMAAHPGYLYPPMRVIFETDIRAVGLEQYHSSVQNWHQRTLSTPMVRTWIACADRRIAWMHRGGGFANTVTGDGWVNFQEYQERGRIALERVISEVGPLPYPSMELMEVSYANSRQMDALQAKINVLKKYPHNIQVWRKYLRFQQPRWFGNYKDTETVIRGAWAKNPENYRLGRLAYDYFYPETELREFWERTEWRTRFKTFTDENPGTFEFVRDGALMLSHPDANDADALYALHIANQLRDYNLMMSILKTHPGIHRKIYDLERDWAIPYLIAMTFWTFGYNGLWEEYDEVYTIIQKHDQTIAVRDYTKTIYQQHDHVFYQLCIEARKNPQGDALDKLFANDGNLNDYLLCYWALYLRGSGYDEKLQNLRDIQPDGRTYRDAQYLLALLENQRGNREVAMQHLDKAESLVLPVRPYIRDEARKLR